MFVVHVRLFIAFFSALTICVGVRPEQCIANTNILSVSVKEEFPDKDTYTIFTHNDDDFGEEKKLFIVDVLFLISRISFRTQCLMACDIYLDI